MQEAKSSSLSSSDNGKGECVEIPQLQKGQTIPKVAHIQTFKTDIKHDLVWVCLDGNSITDIPSFSETETLDMVQTEKRVFSNYIMCFSIIRRCKYP